jgi:hypothetical protein
MAKEGFGKRCALLFALLMTTHVPLHAQELPPGAEPQPSVWGLGALIHPLQLNDDAKLRAQVRAIPQGKKDRVHFLLINGLDPFYTANLNGLAAYCRGIGFGNTACYQMPAATLRRSAAMIQRPASSCWVTASAPTSPVRSPTTCKPTARRSIA